MKTFECIWEYEESSPPWRIILFFETLQEILNLKDKFYDNDNNFEPLIHGQINLIKFIESNKFDNVCNKIWRIFVWSNFEKIGRVVFHQIFLMKKSQSKLKSPRVKTKIQN